MQRTASSVQKTISAPKSPVGASFACDLNGFNGFNEFNDFPCALRPAPCALCLAGVRHMNEQYLLIQKKHLKEAWPRSL